RQAAATMVSIRSQRMSRTIKAKRYNTLAACIKRSIWNDIAYPLAVDRRFGKTPMQTFLSSWVARPRKIGDALVYPYFYFRPEPLMTPIYWNLVLTALGGLKSSRPAASATLRSAPRARAVGAPSATAALAVVAGDAGLPDPLRPGRFRRSYRRWRPMSWSVS